MGFDLEILGRLEMGSERFWVRVRTRVVLVARGDLEARGSLWWFLLLDVTLRLKVCLAGF
jgi:hypothetical protein